MFLTWLKRGCVGTSVLEMPKKGVLFRTKLYLFSRKIGVKIPENVLEITRKRGKISENVLETTRKRGAILSCGTIMRYNFQ